MHASVHCNTIYNSQDIGLPISSDGKKSGYNAGDPGSIPASRRSPGEGIFLPGKSQVRDLRTEEPDGLQSMESQRVRHG